MADPASILSLIAASLSITIKAATIGKDIHSLTSKFRGTTAKVQQLSVHLAAVRVAARSLSWWLEDEAVGSEEVEDVKGQLSEVLSACCILLSDLHDHVTKALAGTEKVGFRGAVNYIWDDEIINETTDTLHHQETAIILMLQALESLNQKQQRARLREHAVVQTLAKAKKPSSSIFGLADDQRSRNSYVSETSERLDMMFAFDTELAGSAVYRNAFTALLRTQMIKRARVATDEDDVKSSVITVSGPKQMEAHSIADGGIGTDQKLDTLEKRKYEAQQATLPITSMRTGARVEKPTWLPQATSNGRLYFFNTLTGEMTFDTPSSGSDATTLKSATDAEPCSPKMINFTEQESKGSIIRTAVHDEVSALWDPHMKSDDTLASLHTSATESTFEEPNAGSGTRSDGSKSESRTQSDCNRQPRIRKRASKPTRCIDDNDKPAGSWIPQATPNGRLFYFHTLTGATSMDMPLFD